MSRFVVVALATVALATVALAAFVLLLLQREPSPTIWAGITAAVQMGTAVVIAILTIELAATARNALAVSVRQTDAASKATALMQEANQHAQIQRAVQSVPILTAKIGSEASSLDDYRFVATLENVTAAPAVR